MARMILACVLILSVPALAAAPPPGSPQSDVMAPYAEWVRGLKNPTTGQGCCSLSDCRVVGYRLTAEGYEAFIDHQTFPGAPDKWLKVPDYVILHQENPTGFAVACWAAWNRESNGWFCFTPSSGA